MADRGFDINEAMEEKGVKVTIPDFKGTGRSQLKKTRGKVLREDCRGKNTC